MKEYVRRNEDRGLDEHDLIRKEEILAHDYERMHNSRFTALRAILRTLIWLSILFVTIRLFARIL
ncbi:MAG: hypothetical protein ACTTKS_04430 [Bulleidia sp.]